jgi:hypothetical protein
MMTESLQDAPLPAAPRPKQDRPLSDETHTPPSAAEQALANEQAALESGEENPV